MPDNLDLFKRNGLISPDGKVTGVLSPPRRTAALQAELKPLIDEAERRHVMLRLGVRAGSIDDDHEEILVFVVDVGGPHDTHAFLRRLATVLSRHGVQPLDYDLDSDLIFQYATDLMQAEPRSV
jgi:hypothetical protein